ncbi:unnamed protein product [Callosobruchus maculatus]|uniref:Uncharacterized protein n=1 Tax=Callosobruchus maculatus TaxID=64391 RepID=A0A653C2A0_CALMS|nr:unnamed protein product [Callosobruchus maculatus]
MICLGIRKRYIYITSLMEKRETGRKYVNESRWNFSYTYFLRIGDTKKQVCKKMFLSTLGIREWMALNWCSKSQSGMHTSHELVLKERKSLRPLSQKSDEKNKYLNNFFTELPKMPSHYCRQRSAKVYLEYNFSSKANLYRVYVNKCEESNIEHVSYCTFSNTFENLNLPLFSPKKDQCNICVAHKAGNIPESDYTLHIQLKDRARAEKCADKEKAKEGKCLAFVMDVQAVKLCPVNNANKFYFKTRLKVHNFTIYNLKTHHCTNYWWNETEGDLSSSVFTTMIIDHLNEHCDNDLPIVLWSDGCPYQNRNAVLSNALPQCAVNHKKLVIQKYLEPGHTQMECDSVHSLIERKLHNREIELPTDYVKVTREARLKPAPYDVKYMRHSDFRNYDLRNQMAYQSIRPGKKAHDPTVTNLREIHYEPEGKIQIKLQFNDELTDLPQRVVKNPSLMPVFDEKLFTDRLKIAKTKFDHLQELKSTLAVEVQGFYDNLSYE